MAIFVGRSGRKSAFRNYAALSRSKMSSGMFSGWKGGLLLASITTSVVLAANLIFTIAAVATSGTGIHFGTLYTGTCAATHRTNTYFHLLINILSTFMLAASNYTMQFLCAPTREQVDRSHETGRWLTIGIVSLRNFQTGKKAALFTILALTSFPIHFL